MRIPTLAVRSLTLAISLGLAFSSSASDTTPAPIDIAIGPHGPAAASPTTLITFGKPGLPSPSTEDGVVHVPASSLEATDVDRLARVPPGSVLAVVASSELPLSATTARTLKQLFDHGVPFLLTMDRRDKDDFAHVTSLFGIAPTTGDALLRRDEYGGVTVFSSKAGGVTAPSMLLSAMLSGSTSPGLMDTGALSRPDAGTPPAENAELLPARHFNLNFVDGQGEVSGVTGIDVVRSYTRSRNVNMVVLTSKATVTSAQNGILDGGSTRKNLWAAYLPFEYRLRHTVTADGVAPVYIDHFPETDGRTEYTQTDTETRGFTIGGSTGSELSATGKPDDVLAAKVPFNASFGYQHTWTSSLSMTFMDYSLLAVPQGNRSVEWKAMIAPRLKNVLVKRWGAGMPQLSEERMTPMMRTTTFNAMSEWSLDGRYNGLATVSISAGYTLDKKEWWWDRSSIRHRNVAAQLDVTTDFVLDMSDPYITPEITVLIRSAVGSGSCLRDNNGDVHLVPCNSADRRQMWGLNAASQYVNRGSQQCLATRPATRSVVTVPCSDALYEKQWQWRADRLHSLSNHGDYRLYVEGGRVHYFAAKGRFQDYPVNPYGAALEPWTNYPNSPRPGIDYQPAPAGGRPLPIGDDWASTFRPVSDDQRWRIEVLRQGL